MLDATHLGAPEAGHQGRKRRLEQRAPTGVDAPHRVLHAWIERRRRRLATEPCAVPLRERDRLKVAEQRAFDVAGFFPRFREAQRGESVRGLDLQRLLQRALSAGFVTARAQRGAQVDPLTGTVRVDLGRESAQTQRFDDVARRERVAREMMHGLEPRRRGIEIERAAVQRIGVGSAARGGVLSRVFKKFVRVHARTTRCVHQRRATAAGFAGK